MIISKRSVILILFSVFTVYFGAMVIVAYLPQYLNFLNTPKPLISLTISIFLSTLFIFPPFIGKISDKLQNRYYFILIGTIGIIFSSFLMLFAKDLILINIFLILLGFSASSFTILFTLYTELVQNESTKISYYNAAIAAGWFTGVQCGGIFIDFFGIQQIFFFSLLIFLISIFFVIFIKEDRQLILEYSLKLNEANLNENSESFNEGKNTNFKSLYYSIFFRSFGIRPILGIIVIIMGFHLTSSTEIGFLIGINPLLQFFLLISIGRLITNKNLKKFMLLGYILSVIIIIGYIFSFDFWSFLVIQILVSSSYSIFWMASVIYIAKNSTPKNKGSFIGKANASGFAGDSMGGLFFSLLLVIFQSNYYVSMYFMIIFPIISLVVISLKFKPK
ncbi:hypothetical protein LCGC14_1379890 [marine sediment metagenome]|uniref:Major facilitator superfamily (MFS) profile domain-containing protein n=1 Tax=marine sediment metagenome TaxID=412755 RepID=A0A0F9MIC6_9ZZZZ|nr:MFS transporter [archaeon]